MRGTRHHVLFLRRILDHFKTPKLHEPTCGRFEYADFTMLYTIVQSLHKLQLDIIRFIWMMEFLAIRHSGACHRSDSWSVPRKEYRFMDVFMSYACFEFTHSRCGDVGKTRSSHTLSRAL